MVVQGVGCGGVQCGAADRFLRHPSALPTVRLILIPPHPRLRLVHSALSLSGARLVWRSGLAHNRLKKFDRAKTDLKRACVPWHLPSHLCFLHVEHALSVR